MANNKNLAEDSKATQFPHNDPTKGGRPLSFKSRYKELYEEDEGVIWIPKSAALQRTRKVEKRGEFIEVEEIGLPLQKRDQILAKLDRLIANGKEAISLNAIKFIWEQIDGKPKQEIDLSGSIDNTVKRLTPEERKQFNDELESEY